MEKTLSSQTLRMAVKALEKMRVDPNPFLEEADISRVKLSNPVARIPIKKELRFWKSAYEKTADPNLTLRMAENVPFGTFPMLEYLGASCQSIYQALVFFAKYVEIIYGNWYPKLTEKGQLVQFNLGSEGDAEEFRFTNEFGLALMKQRLCDFAGQAVPLEKVHFKHRLKGGLDKYEKFFGTEVLFEQSSNSLFFDKKIKKMPCKNSDGFVLGTILNLAQKLFDKLPGRSPATSNPFVAQVGATVRQLLHDGEPEAKKIAKEIGTSTRTLQRKLETAGTSLTEIISSERKTLAAELLKSPELTNEEIALMLGYSTLSAFNKAFRQWFKMTPSEFRKTLNQ